MYYKVFGFGFSFSDFYSLQGLSKLEECFKDFCSQEKFTLDGATPSEVIIKQALMLEQFIIQLFDINAEFQHLMSLHKNPKISYNIKRNFIQKRLHNRECDIIDAEEKLKSILNTGFITDEIYAIAISEWLKDEIRYKHNLDIALQYAKDQIDLNSKRAIFSIPKNLRMENLISVDVKSENGLEIVFTPEKSFRSGFDLTDKCMSTDLAVHNAKYCIYCHQRGKDSCRKGMYKKKQSLKLDMAENPLEGCPLDQKISEMNWLKANGNDIAALCIVMIDNPLCPATGHRICNDCMKSCIYQKQEPVNIPGVESNILANVLSLPYGFEIYSLLARWNPLNNTLMQPYNGKKILVVGMGPSGFSLAYYLLNMGYLVVGIEGLKVERLPEYLVDNNDWFEPIKNVKDLYENLSERVVHGFGGVAEYGITSRWNKNYLKIIRILLERYKRFYIKGSVSLGANITLEQAFEEFKFDHVALATGSGKPKVPDIKNFFLSGVLMASDFLMSLNLNVPYQFKSVSNLEISLPIIVIGGGLTAVDAATEALAYYPIQVEKFLSHYEYVAKSCFGDAMEDLWPNEKQCRRARVFIDHARLFRKLKGDKSKLRDLVCKIGGVKLIYRKRMIDSPAYCFNHQELNAALEEGVEFIECLSPIEFMGDQYISKASFHNSKTGQLCVLDVGSVLVAVGNEPKGIEQKHLDSGRVTVFGDADPKYAGSVVKAIASAKYGFKKVISAVMRDDLHFSVNADEIHSNNDDKFDGIPHKEKFFGGKFFLNIFSRLLSSRLLEVNILSSNIIELVIESPMAARNFSPGQFYRFQASGMEPIALTGSSIEEDRISLVILEMGGSSSLCRYLIPGCEVSLMGPCGNPTYIPCNKTVLLIGGGLGNAVLFSIGKAMRAKKCMVLYCAGYRTAEDRFKIKDLENASDIIVWACESKILSSKRKNDFSFKGNVIEALKQYSSVQCSALGEVDHIVVIGSDQMMAACAIAFKGCLYRFLRKEYSSVAVLNSPMQCMMQGICAKCIQRLHSGSKECSQVIFSCIAQDQPIDAIDFHCLRNRLLHNAVSERLTHRWVDKKIVDGEKQFWYSDYKI